MLSTSIQYEISLSLARPQHHKNENFYKLPEIKPKLDFGTFSPPTPSPQISGFGGKSKKIQIAWS